MIIKKLIRRSVRKMGYDLVSITDIDLHGGSFKPNYLRKLLNAKTVIDVGGADGTEGLYDSFPHAQFILIEPLDVYDESLSDLQKKYDCKIIKKAVGSYVGNVSIEVDSSNPKWSSVFERTALTHKKTSTVSRTVSITTLDEIFQSLDEAERPILLKIDIEGNEMEALKGAENLLSKVAAVILEVSVAPRFVASYHFDDVVAFMGRHGFQTYSFLSISHARGELQPRFVDVVFKRPTESK